MPEIDNLSRMLDLAEFVFSKVLLRELLLGLTIPGLQKRIAQQGRAGGP